MKSKLRLKATGSSIITSIPPFANTMCLLHNSNIQKICIKIGYFVNLNMQGKKNFTPQLFVSVNLLDLVPKDNFTENC